MNTFQIRNFINQKLTQEIDWRIFEYYKHETIVKELETIFANIRDNIGVETGESIQNGSNRSES